MNGKTKQIVTAALFAALACVATMVIKIPSPMDGYLNLGDCVVLAAPIYCMGLPAQAKALVDRAQVFRSRKYVLGWPVIPEERKGKRIGLFLGTAGQDWDHVFEAALPSVKCFFHVSAIRERETRYLLINGVDEAGAVRTHPTAQAEAGAIADEMIALITERLSS